MTTDLCAGGAYGPPSGSGSGSAVRPSSTVAVLSALCDLCGEHSRLLQSVCPVWVLQGTSLRFPGPDPEVSGHQPVPFRNPQSAIRNRLGLVWALPGTSQRQFPGHLVIWSSGLVAFRTQNSAFSPRSVPFRPPFALHNASKALHFRVTNQSHASLCQSHCSARAGARVTTAGRRTENWLTGPRGRLEPR